jgi:hypothetical protein
MWLNSRRLELYQAAQGWPKGLVLSALLGLRQLGGEHRAASPRSSKRVSREQIYHTLGALYIGAPHAVSFVTANASQQQNSWQLL